MRGFTLVDLAEMRTRGEGVQNPENFADVLYEWSLLLLFPSDGGTLTCALLVRALHFY